MLISNYWYLLKDTIYSPLSALYVSVVCQSGVIMIRKVKYIEVWDIFLHVGNLEMDFFTRAVIVELKTFSTGTCKSKILFEKCQLRTAFCFFVLQKHHNLLNCSTTVS